MSRQRSMSEADREQLAALNDAVEAALEERTQWLDAKMAEYATVPVGEMLYDLGKRCALGRVKRHYRYDAERPGCLDDHLNIDYEYEVDAYSSDNTSRHGRHVGSKAELIEEQRARVRELEASA